jgi:EAL domain-containing protein (putative c-di-GMP-specific phosphodiesterase class I)
MEASTPPPAIVRGRALIVDDDVAFARAQARILRADGIECEIAGDGASAARVLARTDFDVVVSDIVMPGLDGIAFLRAVHEHDQSLPVILLTGRPDIETAVRAIEQGVFRYLAKPVKADDLRDAVRRAVEARAGRDKAGKNVLDAAARGALEASLDRALRSLRMVYQPIVSWKERRLLAFEALVRNGEPSLPHPGALLSAAEKIGRLAELGRMIRLAVSETVGALPDRQIFMNLHPRDLLDDDLFNATSALARVAGRVTLEMTERAALDEVPDVTERVANLRSLGFRIAVDDLGAGYAGLTTLATLRPDVVKIDMSLVRAVHNDALKQRLVGSMASLCRDIGMMVVAEGVEVAEERDALVRCGCDTMQGYLFGRPSASLDAPVLSAS